MLLRKVGVGFRVAAALDDVVELVLVTFVRADLVRTSLLLLERRHSLTCSTSNQSLDFIAFIITCTMAEHIKRTEFQRDAHALQLFGDELPELWRCLKID